MGVFLLKETTEYFNTETLVKDFDSTVKLSLAAVSRSNGDKKLTRNEVQEPAGNFPSRSIGNVRMRIPIASKIAFATAGASPTIGVSPAPNDG